MKLIKTTEYLLLIDETNKAKEGNYVMYRNSPCKIIVPNSKYYAEMGMLIIQTNEKFVSYPLYKNEELIIAYYPLTNTAKDLDLVLLPNPRNEKESAYKLSEKRFPSTEDERFEKVDFNSLRIGFVEGYSAAQSRQYTLEDIKKAIQYGSNMSKMDRGEIGYVTESNFIDTLSDDLPTKFIPESKEVFSHFANTDDGGWPVLVNQLNIVNNELKGTYKY